MEILSRVGRHGLSSVVFLLAFWLSLFSPQVFSQSSVASSSLIWVAMSQAVVGVNAVDESTVNIALEHDPEALAIDERQQRVWIYQSGVLSSYSFDGVLLLTRELKLTHGRASGMWVDAEDGTLWLLANKQLLKIDELGGKRFEISLSAQAIGTYDTQQKLLWVAQDDSLSAFSHDGAMVENTNLGSRVHALRYDAFDQSLKFVAGDSLLRLDAAGDLLELMKDRRIRQVEHLVVDRDGVTWMADHQNVIKLMSSGQVVAYRPLQQFAPEIIVDIVSAEAGGLWVANWRELVHLGDTGEIIDVISPALTGKRERNIFGLAENNKNAGPQLLVLYPEEGSYINSASPQLVVKLENSEIDAGSVQLSTDEGELSVSCETQGDKALCLLDNPLTNGDYKITVTASNVEGQRSMAVELNFNIDTKAPQITVTSPQSGMITNIGQISVSGRTDEFAVVTISGNTALLDQDHRFEVDSLPLVEGENLILIEAIDRASNSSQEGISVNLDTIAPDLPNTSLIDVSFVPDGPTQVTGQSGSVEAGSTLTIINSRTGEQVVVQAGSSGSFSVEIGADDGDTLAISVTDAAGNTSDVAELHVEAVPGAEPLELSFVSPQENEVVSGDHVLATLRLDGPENSGVVVNGSPATLLSNTDGSVTAYAWVPLSAGSNTLTAIATDMDDRTISTSVTVQAQLPSYYGVSASTLTGVGPLDVTFEIQDKNRAGITDISIDFDGDGTSDQVYSGEQDSVEYTYEAGSGLNRTTFLIRDKRGAVHEEVVPILVLDQESLDSRVRLIWSGMVSALNEGDVESALKYMVSGSRENYRAIFEVLLPYIPEITAGFSDIYQLDLYSDMASYVLMTAKDGEARVFVA